MKAFIGIFFTVSRQCMKGWMVPGLLYGEAEYWRPYNSQQQCPLTSVFLHFLLEFPQLPFNFINGFGNGTFKVVMA